MGVSSRRAPWPYDATLGDVGLMLRPSQDGLLVSRKMTTLDESSPVPASYATQPVYKERALPFRPLLGMGQSVQTGPALHRYHYGLNVWRVGNVFGKGPKFTTLAPTDAGEVRDFPEALHGGALTQFILAGRYVKRRDGDTVGAQTTSKDLGVGLQANSAVRFQGAYASPVDGLYVSVNDGALWEYDGASWNSCALPAGFLAEYLERVGTELWAGGGNEVRKCDGDPKLAASWSAAILVGDTSTRITALRQTANTLFIFKSDGSIYTLNGVDDPATGTSNDLFPGLRVTPDLTNGRNAAAWDRFVWFRKGGSFYRLDVEDRAQIASVGPERLLDLRGPVRGHGVVFAGHDAWAGYLGVYNATGADSYLYQLGQWLPPSEGDEGRYDFADLLDGALIVWEGKQITALKVSTLVAGNPRLYAGFSDGTYGWCLLPTNGPNPFAADSGCTFTAATSELYLPVLHGMTPADFKAWRGVSVFGPTLSATNRATVSMRIAESASFATLAANHTASGQRVDSADNTASKQLEAKIALTNASETETPVLEGLDLAYSVRPALQWERRMTALARNHVARRDGGTSRRSAEQIRALIHAAAGAPGSVTLVLPDEESRSASVLDIAEALRPDRARYGQEWDITFSVVDFRTNETYGTVGRLRPYLIADLAGYSVEELGTL